VLKYVLTGLQVLQTVAIIGRAFGIVALRSSCLVRLPGDGFGGFSFCFSLRVVNVDPIPAGSAL
jgi:hypothetical protein